MAKSTASKSSDPRRVLFARIAMTVLGCFLLAYGMVVSIQVELGVAPWTVLDLGITNHIPLSLGRASQVTSLVVLGVSFLLGVHPNWGTIANIFLVGTFLDSILALNLAPSFEGFLPRLISLLGGLLVMGLGIATYVSAGFGAGPRDSLMLGVTQKTGFRVGPVRSVIESSVVVIGYLLGGPVGIGTILSAIITGPIVERYFVQFAHMKRRPFWSEVIHLPGSVRIGNLEAEE